MAKNRLRISFPTSNGEKWKQVVEQAKKIGPDKSIKILSGEKVEDETPEDKLEKDFAFRKLRAEKKDILEKYNALIKKYERVTGDFDNYVAISTIDVPKNILNVQNTFNKNKLIPIVQFTDWHVDESVEPNTVNGLNEFTLDIAKTRVEKLTSNLLAEIAKYRLHSDIKQIIIHLGGDYISNTHHAELAETNNLSPIDATIFAKNLLINSIQEIVDKGKLDKIVLLCNKGNHGRISPNMQFNNEAGTSLESIIYDSIRSHFKGDKRVDVVNPDAGIGYYTIFNNDNREKFVLRFFHGQQLKSMGGIGGISIPLNKFMMRLDSTQPADFTMLGHFHQLSYAKSYSVNGSLVGYNAFALQHGFSYEKPLQSFMIYDVNKNMITNRSFLLCE